MGMINLRRQIISDNLQIKSVSGNPAIFTADIARKVKSCNVTFLPIQSGSETPSPSNVRPISGLDSIVITVNGSESNFPLGDTYYGGDFDLLSGRVTITKKKIHVNYSDFTGISSGYGVNRAPYRIYTGQLSGVKAITNAVDFPDSMICDKVATIDEPTWYPKIYAGFINETSRFLVGVPSDLSTLDLAKNWVQSIGGFDVVTYLSNPIQLQISGGSIVTQKGQNIFETVSGIINVEYYAH